MSGSDTSEVVVVIFLRGGCDGLHLVAPVEDPNYQAARSPELRLQGSGPDPAYPLDQAPTSGDFRLHPAAAQLKELYDSHHLAIVHACGLTHGTRSHFEAQALMESGSAQDLSLETGWLSRHLMSTSTSDLIPALAVAPHLPQSLLGSSVALAMPELEEFQLFEDDPMFNQALMELYGGEGSIQQTAQQLFRVVERVSDLDLVRERDRDLYPEEGWGEELGYGLSTLAQLIKRDWGLQIATLDYGDWDTHEEQDWRFQELVSGLSQGLAAFYTDLGEHQRRVTLLVMTEFGRRLRANESYGTDHGYGSVMMILGGRVNGGKIYGGWPGLAHEQLAERADLAITTDYRTVLAEILTQRLGTPRLDRVLPGYEPQPYLGILS